MQTHDDFDAYQKMAGKQFDMDRLKDRADKMAREGLSQITAGKRGEQAIAKYDAKGVHVVKMPDDEQGILRISIGGGVPMVNVNYCTYRGDKQRCIEMIEKALEALKAGSAE